MIELLGQFCVIALAIPTGVYLALPMIRKIRFVSHSKKEGYTLYSVFLKEDKEVNMGTLSKGGKEL